MTPHEEWDRERKRRWNYLRSKQTEVDRRQAAREKRRARWNKVGSVLSWIVVGLLVAFTVTLAVITALGYGYG